MTSAQIGIATYSYSASFDTLARPTDVKTSRVSDGATLFEEAPTYDALGNITRETTTLPTGTDIQQFCYDDFSRLTWAGSTGTPPCTGTAITPGTLTAAQYTQSFSYDNQDRLRSSPLGSYSYDDPAHLHAATFVDIGSGSDDYSATYDASGNMLTRAPSESQSQQKLSWDNEGRLTAWQNAPSSPTSTAQYLYDGEGNRVEQQTTTSGTTTTVVYVGSLESVAASGGNGTTTNYNYDDLNQLTQVKAGSIVTASYCYDANHNRISLATATRTTSYACDSSDHLTQKTDLDGNVQIMATTRQTS